MWHLVTQVREETRQQIKRLLTATDVFTEEEMLAADDLLVNIITTRDSTHIFLFAYDNMGILQGFTCYKEIPLTHRRYHLCWIGVAPSAQKSGLGSFLLEKAFDHIRLLGGEIVYAEIPNTEAYNAAHHFFKKNHFKLAGEIKDFYKAGTSKLIFSRVVQLLS